VGAVDDYDTDPDRFRTGQRVTREHARADLYDEIARQLAGRARVLDVACGEGAVARARPGVIGLDRSPTMLSAAPDPRLQGDARALPFADASLDAVVTINALYHLDDPVAAIAEAHRVLAPGGLFAAATVSRYDSPELAAVWRPEPSTFDSEDAPDLVRAVFGVVEVDSWDAPLVRLPDTATVREYLVARFVPLEQAAAAAERVPAPLDVTKRGCIVYAER
jgi:SAM-dependent methyltransferase